MKKKYLLLGAIIGIALIFVLQPKKEKPIKTREQIIKEEKEKKFDEEFKAAKKELEETRKRNEELEKERVEQEKEESLKVEEIKTAILSEKDKKIREEKLDTFLKEIDTYKYSRRFSIPALEEIKEKGTKDEMKKINERLYKLYESIDDFDKAEKIKVELEGGNVDGAEVN
jgi:hypothetical protein